MSSLPRPSPEPRPTSPKGEVRSTSPFALAYIGEGEWARFSEGAPQDLAGEVNAASDDRFAQQIADHIARKAARRRARAELEAARAAGLRLRRAAKLARLAEDERVTGAA